MVTEQSRKCRACKHEHECELMKYKAAFLGAVLVLVIILFGLVAL